MLKYLSLIFVLLSAENTSAHFPYGADYNGFRPQYIRVALLYSGEKVEYDACSGIDNEKAAREYKKNGFWFLGKGKIHSINGVEQSNHDKCRFWVKLKPLNQ